MDPSDSLLSSNAWAFQSPTFGKDGSFEVNEAVGSASISPCGRDIVLASRQGLHIIDLDNPYSPPRHLPHRTPWEVADVQWSPFASRDYWVVSTSNQKALVWNLEMTTSQAPIEHVLHAHSRAITDINFSAHDPDLLATCAIDSFVHCWDLRNPQRPAITLADWFAGATQVKWNRQDPHIIASSHDRYLHVWDDRKALHPLRTISAHATKIYGIDWNRTSSTRLLTCSLDKTIKLWDYSQEDSQPTHVIETSFPVWRARHTPFGNGILAMPQRGDFNLHLYNYEEDQVSSASFNMPAVHCFSGHHNQVKEFLWRVRGSIDSQSDDREFQLVTWSNDKSLLLHRVDENILAKVDYVAGHRPETNLKFTRRGAQYRSFHSAPAQQTIKDYTEPHSGAGLRSLFHDLPRAGELRGALHSSSKSSSGMNIWNLEKRGHNPITWMKGVKISKTEAVAADSNEVPRMVSSQAAPWDTLEGLGDEITHVGDKYKNVTFEEVNVPGRSASVALNGPWGLDGGLVHIRFSLLFPHDYPDNSPPDFTLEKRSAVSDATFTKLSIGLRTIADGYASLGKGSFEALLGYLLGERDLDETTAWLNQEANLHSIHSGRLDGESSSDEDDAGLEPFGFSRRGLEDSATDTVATTNQTAHPPSPKTCGAVWTHNGSLVCFFPNRESKFSITASIPGDEESTTRSPRTFAGFGRLPLIGSKGTKTATSTNTAPIEDNDSAEESVSSTSLSSSSSESSVENSFFPQPTWRSSSLRRPYLRSLDRSIKSSAPTAMKHSKAIGAKSFASVHDLSQSLPAKQELGLEYRVHGDAAAACLENADIAARHGYQNISDVWSLVHLLLFREVPLEVLSVSTGTDDIFVLAHRALAPIRRRDSGLDLAFDEPRAVPTSKNKASVKWGHHPFATWMVEKIFQHFEQAVDIQMYAMLSCVFMMEHDEAFRAHAGASESTDLLYCGSTPLYGLAPSQTYFPNFEVAMSINSLPAPDLAPTSPQKFLQTQVAYSSHESSVAGASSERAASDRLDVSSAVHTPSLMTREHSRTSTGAQSFDASPDQLNVQRSTSSFSNSLGLSFTRSFSLLGTSPPVQHVRRRSGELSTSAPGSNGGITWGRNQVFEASKASAGRRRSSGRAEHEFDSSSDVDSDIARLDDLDFEMTLKNQTMFDDEAHISLSLLSYDIADKARACREAYANLLYAWNFPLAACEIKNFNTPVHLASVSEVDDAAVEPATQELVNAPAKSSDDDEDDYLKVEIICGQCGNPGKTKGLSTQVQPPECSKSHTVNRPATCSFCFEKIGGIFKACLRCGHATHLACMQQWLADEDLSNPQCESGCGCSCWEGGFVHLEESDPDGAIEVDSDLHEQVRRELSGDLWKGFSSASGEALQRLKSYGAPEDDVLPWALQQQYREISIARRKFSNTAYDDI